VELVDWWMDDWISSVYGSNRSFMSKDVTITHHAKYHGPRYAVNESNRHLLKPLTIRARDQIVSWMQQPENGVAPHTSNELSTYYSSHSVSDAADVQFVSNDGSIGNYFEIEVVNTTNLKTGPKRKKVSGIMKPKPKSTRTATGKKKQLSKPTTFQNLPMPDCMDKNADTMSQPLIAILSGSTSRSENNPSNSTLSVFTIMLPSLMRSLDCGFRYVVVIGFDKGDPFYDSKKVTYGILCSSIVTPALVASLYSDKRYLSFTLFIPMSPLLGSYRGS
jgi:hypothetical protein